MPMKMVCLENTRADYLFEVSQLAQVTEDLFEKATNLQVRRLNKAVELATDNHFVILLPKINRGS